MEKLTASRKYDTSQSQTHNGNSSNNDTIKPNPQNTQLLEQVPIDDSPFTAIKIDEKWFLTMGKYRLTEPLHTLEECKDEANNTTWIRVMQVIQIMIEENNQKTK